jgi:hypothetical protein
MSSNLGELIKQLITVFGERPPRGLPKPPPPHRVQIPRNLHMEKTPNWDAGAESTRGIETRRKGEWGKNNAILNNLITKQHFDTIFHRKMCIPFLLLIALTNCAYHLSASLASENRVLYIECKVYKRMPELLYQPALSRLHSILQATPL